MAKIVKLVCSLFSFCYESRERSLHSQVSVSLKSQIFPLKEMVKNSVFSVLSSVLVTSQEEVFTFLSRLVCVCVVWWGWGGGGKGWMWVCVCMPVCESDCDSAWACVYESLCVCTRVCVWEWGGVHMYGHALVCMSVCLCVGVHVIRYVCVCMHACAPPDM